MVWITAILLSDMDCVSKKKKKIELSNSVTTSKNEFYKNLSLTTVPNSRNINCRL